MNLTKYIVKKLKRIAIDKFCSLLWVPGLNILQIFQKKSPRGSAFSTKFQGTLNFYLMFAWEIWEFFRKAIFKSTNESLLLQLVVTEKSFDQTEKEALKRDIWCKVFKNEPSKICGRQPLKNLKGYGLL